jgi:hypothetical protein
MAVFVEGFDWRLVIDLARHRGDDDAGDDANLLGGKELR